MRSPTATHLLEAWERGLSQPPVRRALTLLHAACPDAGVDALAGLPVGERDGRLLDLRETLFGPTLTLVAACPHCEETMESAFEVGDIRVPPLDDGDGRPMVEAGAYTVAFRAPTSRDLAAIAALPDAAAARQALVTRCCVEVTHGGVLAAPDDLPDSVVTMVAEGMALADPQADVRLDVTCPTCGHAWQALFDITAVLWREVHAWALRTLRDVDTLARVYGWREADVLALSPTRREIYLELARR
jgi:hypothetical protein